MICPQCGHPHNKVMQTFNEKTTFTRRRKCLKCGELYYTVETYRDKLDTRMFSGMTRLARRTRDIKIAKELHKGWELLMQEYGLTRTAIYYAAARGRKHLGLEHQNAVSYRKGK